MMERPWQLKFRRLHCNLTIDRDVNAKNILARGLRFKPAGSASESMVTESNALQLKGECNPQVDADQSTSKLGNESTS